MNVHCSTVYNGKDLEPTQMPIDDRLERENMAHIHHGILCSHKRRWVHVLCRDMGEPGNHHSQQTYTRTENQTLHALICRQVLNKQWEHVNTGRGASHTGVWQGEIGKGRRGGELGRDSMEGNARYKWWGGRQQITLSRVYLCNNLACSSHLPQNEKCNKIKKINKVWLQIPTYYLIINSAFSQIPVIVS